MTDLQPQGAHLVGSINFPDAETTMRAAAASLGDRLRRIPDGEVGDRFHWISFQANKLAETPGLERVGDKPFMVSETIDVRPVRVSDGVADSEIHIGNLGYADAAEESWAVFARLQADGVIPAETRFQVALPTPSAVVGAFVIEEDRARLEPFYRDALYAELDRITSAIPHNQLAIQWDTAVEFGFIEDAGYPKNAGRNAPWFEDVWAGVIERAADQASRVPAGVELGFHLCYGDMGEKHFVEPTDAANLARFANEAVAASPRPVTWVHMPVPIDRVDDEFYAPLTALDLPAETELYLGLMHREDGAAGAGARIAVAKRFVPAFGVATECGCGRTPQSHMHGLLDAHTEVSSAW